MCLNSKLWTEFDSFMCIKDSQCFLGEKIRNKSQSCHLLKLSLLDHVTTFPIKTSQSLVKISIYLHKGLQKTSKCKNAFAIINIGFI